MSFAPIALTCGEPAGVGLGIAERAWTTLKGEVPFFLIADPAHLPGSVPHKVLQSPLETKEVIANALPVLPHPFASPLAAGARASGNGRHSSVWLSAFSRRLFSGDGGGSRIF